MLKEDGHGKIVWRLDGAIFDPKVSPDPPERNWSLLKQIRCPALIVRGGVSDLITREIVDRMVQMIPGSRAVEIPDAGHMVLEDNPPAFNQAVMEFLRGLPRPPAARDRKAP
jgi:pimeloyl-ACP methyl ester carboxylesterase